MADAEPPPPVMRGDLFALLDPDTPGKDVTPNRIASAARKLAQRVQSGKRAPGAPVVITVFTDFQCPFCARHAQNVDALKLRYGPENLRIAYKHNPLDFHEDAYDAAASQLAWERTVAFLNETLG